MTEFLFGGDVDVKETMRARAEAAKDAFERTERQERELRDRLASEISILESMTNKYSEALREQFNRRTEILRLRAHVKANILYYMQAIWNHEPVDQRFFRLYNLRVPEIKIIPEYKISDSPGYLWLDGKKTPITIGFSMPSQINVEWKTLVEVADIDNLLGYKGNYMIFPLKENNSITMFMMQDYVEINETAHLWDPDEAGNYTIDEMKDLIKCYYKRFPESFSQ